MKLWERAQPSINIGLLETPPDHAVRAHLILLTVAILPSFTYLPPPRPPVR